MPHSPVEPRFSLTLPSIHDDTPLNARIYHPSPPPSNATHKQRKRGIVMAHPYAPMGGSYDDRIVHIVVDAFLALGYTVCTFNFRGAYGGKGRTSWGGRAEVRDFVSFVGFFAHYLAGLGPPDSVVDGEEEEGDTVLVLGGYSYGSTILRHIPPLAAILDTFAAPVEGSAAAEILLRARALAAQANTQGVDATTPRKRGHRQKLSVTMGGEETSPEQRRSSREIRRSLDASPSLGHRLRSLKHGDRRQNHASASPSPSPLPSPRLLPTESTKKSDVPVPEVRYLLVSPLTPPISTLAAPALSSFWSRGTGEDANLAGHNTLVVYGDQDGFASARRMADWVARMQTAATAKFEAVGVEGVGHFWAEAGVEGVLRDVLRRWGGGGLIEHRR